MVLQAGADTAVWGEAAPGERVRVSLHDTEAQAEADAAGSWRVELDLRETPPGPHELRIEGNTTVVLSDVLVGDVWVASGQSNMEWRLEESSGGTEEAAASANPFIRHFKVEKAVDAEPAGDVKGSWAEASPATSGSFSAIAYYFAKEVVAATGRPVGILNATWGGTRIQGWIPIEAFDALHGGPAEREKLWSARRAFPERQRKYAEAMKAWIDSRGRQDSSGVPESPFIPKEGGVEKSATVSLPGTVEGWGIPAAGVVWLKRRFSLPEKGGPVILQVPVNGLESVYFNGRLLGSTRPENFPGTGNTRRFTIPEDQATGTDHEIAIRLYQPAEPAVFPKAPVVRNLLETLPLDGDWEVVVERTYADAGCEEGIPEAPPQPVAPQWLPSGLHNGMVAPLHAFGVRGILWYQGESNAGTAGTPYSDLFRALVSSWRQAWKQEDLPFFFCQLAAHKEKTAEASAESEWARLRESQSSVLDLPATGLAVLIDAGEAGDVHPRDKKTPGHRLARLALAKVHGRDLPHSGPVPVSMTVVGRKAVIDFANAHGGLVARPLAETHVVSSQAGESAPLIPNSPGSLLQGFAVRGADGIWHWAEGTLEEGKAVVWSGRVESPVEVRYAWADNPTANLYNAAGLPAGPIRIEPGKPPAGE